MSGKVLDFGHLERLADLAADLFGKAKRPRFEPMQFAPGAAELEASQLAYARQLADLLEARPRLTVTVCGVATPGEGALGAEVEAEAGAAAGTEAATADGALALARDRADALAALLRERVDAARVFDCLPEVDAAPAAVPRVEILL